MKKVGVRHVLGPYLLPWQMSLRGWLWKWARVRKPRSFVPEEADRMEYDGPMPRQPTRFRLVILGMTLALLAVVVAAWWASFWTPFTLGRTVPFTLERSTADGRRATMLGPHHRLHFTNSIGKLRVEWDIDMQTPTPSEDVSFALGPAEWSLERLSPLERSLVMFDLPRGLTGRSAEVLGMWAGRWGSAPGGPVGMIVSRRTLVTLLAALTIWLWYPIYTYSKRPKKGHCPTCGYDHKGLAPATGCPECGEGQPLASAS